VHHAELAPRAVRDLRKIKDVRAARDVARCLQEELTADPHPANIDVKPLRGNEPWLRLRCGEHRVIFRSLNHDELKSINAKQRTGYLVARIIDCAELDRAVRSL
jgi:mRNA-degrading endonuclease RelE of RelBE toxin-antitoxin system